MLRNTNRTCYTSALLAGLFFVLNERLWSFGFITPKKKKERKQKDAISENKAAGERWSEMMESLQAQICACRKNKITNLLLESSRAVFECTCTTAMPLLMRSSLCEFTGWLIRALVGKQRYYFTSSPDGMLQTCFSAYTMSRKMRQFSLCVHFSHYFTNKWGIQLNRWGFNSADTQREGAAGLSEQSVKTCWEHDENDLRCDLKSTAVTRTDWGLYKPLFVSVSPPPHTHTHKHR